MAAAELPAQARLRLEDAGKWVAWSEGFQRVVAAGDDPVAVHEAARGAGEPRAVYEWVPPVPVRPIDPDV